MSPNRALLAGAAAVAMTAASTACGPVAPACSADCPNVAGSYSAIVASADAARSTCKSLSFRGYTGRVPIAVIQSGNAVTLSLWDLSGTIDSKLGFQSPAQSITIYEGDNMTGPGEPGTASLSGVFGGQEGSRNFAGNLLVTRSSDRCMLPVPIQLVQVEH